ncbi:Unknown protein [Striga hermonthica]|uniref:F-box domain-containing protein n=1 Tax=Striga hermonthica TaxID=68872 RepID=A0A9N7R3L0_STRHE|nr:Unknown protein [Striga hermonthica]
MAEFPLSVSRQPPDEVEAQAQINPLISLPDDVLFKILLNLCAEDIYRAGLVCRSLYYRTIRSDKFIKLHLRQNEYGLFFRFSSTRNGQHSSPRPIFVSMKQGRVTVSDYNNYTDKFRYILKNSCNGLFPDYKFWEPLAELHLSNPLTRRALRLPPPPKNAMSTFICVGYAEASKAYKVVLAYSDDGGRNAHMRWAVLTVGIDRSWRNLATEHLRETPLIYFPVVTEGFLHWTPCGNIDVGTLV